MAPISACGLLFTVTYNRARTHIWPICIETRRPEQDGFLCVYLATIRFESDVNGSAIFNGTFRSAAELSSRQVLRFGSTSRRTWSTSSLYRRNYLERLSGVCRGRGNFPGIFRNLRASARA